jgi:hypothetical protein
VKWLCGGSVKWLGRDAPSPGSKSLPELLMHRQTAAWQTGEHDVLVLT